MLTTEELETLLAHAHKSLALGDGTVRIDANDLACLVDAELNRKEADKYQADLDRDIRQLRFEWDN